jgi:hypothetical protein
MTPLSVILACFLEMRGARAPVVFVMFGYRQISFMPDNEIA